jgi:hypothetical protein
LTNPVSPRIIGMFPTNIFVNWYGKST